MSGKEMNASLQSVQASADKRKDCPRLSRDYLKLKKKQWTLGFIYYDFLNSFKWTILYTNETCTDPNWDRTVTERTSIHLKVQLNLKTSNIYRNLCIYLQWIHLFKELECSNFVELTVSLSSSKSNFSSK